MAEMGKYCKAYLAKDLRAYGDWTENLDNLRQEEDEDGQPTEPRTELGDEDILYLQENYVVTDGIFKDENIIFDQVTDEWKTFCTDELQFEIPVYEPIVIPQEDGEAEAAEDAGSEEE